MTWAADRKPPSNEYLLFEAQPPRMIPYAPIDVNARMYKIPTLMSLITKGLNCNTGKVTPIQLATVTIQAGGKFAVVSGPKGTTAKPINAGTRARRGARLNRNLFAPA